MTADQLLARVRGDMERRMVLRAANRLNTSGQALTLEQACQLLADAGKDWSFVCWVNT